MEAADEAASAEAVRAAVGARLKEAQGAQARPGARAPPRQAFDGRGARGGHQGDAGGDGGVGAPGEGRVVGLS